MRQTSDIILQLDRNEIEHSAGSRRLDDDAEQSTTPTPFRAGCTGVIVGVLMGFNELFVPLVDFSENKEKHAVEARTTTALSFTQIGSEVILTFEQCDLTKPIILGCLQRETLLQRDKIADVQLDGERVTLSAEREIVLKCGEASITLTRAGKILIRGSYLLSRSSGVNRIKGGSVQIN
jgi:Domain of unknown function (DUF6484)